jgi:hypothetical protein
MSAVFKSCLQAKKRGAGVLELRYESITRAELEKDSLMAIGITYCSQADHGSNSSATLQLNGT